MAMRRENDTERRETLRRLHDRLGDMARAKQTEKDRRQIVKEHYKSEKILVEQGKKPFYLRKGDVTRLHLAKQFEKIKKSVKSDEDLERVLEKRRKRKVSRQRKHMPDQ
jgi:ribosomal RNA-processing protein 36